MGLERVRFFVMNGMVCGFGVGMGWRIYLDFMSFGTRIGHSGEFTWRWSG